MIDENRQTLEMVASTLAHEVKNPLSLIKANIDYMELCDTEKTYSDCYRVIKNELAKANEIVKEFIYSINEERNIKEEIDIKFLINEVIEKYDSSAYSKIKFTKVDIKRSVIVRGNYENLKILFSNIIKNSVESVLEKNNKSSKQIRIELKIANKYVHVVVIDNGLGLNRKAINKIQKNEIYTSKENGNGVGINICKNIVLKHDGKYYIGNRIGGGCIVRIAIPILRHA
jgi:nitrogen fixation/metabolism regulation signal transduction histidine kinase